MNFTGAKSNGSPASLRNATDVTDFMASAFVGGEWYPHRKPEVASHDHAAFSVIPHSAHTQYSDQPLCKLSRTAMDGSTDSTQPQANGRGCLSHCGIASKTEMKGVVSMPQLSFFSPKSETLLTPNSYGGIF